MGWFFLVFIVIFVVVCYWLVGTAPKGSASPRFVSKARPKTDAVEDAPRPQFTTELETLISIDRQLKMLNFRMIGLMFFLFILFLTGWRVFTL